MIFRKPIRYVLLSVITITATAVLVVSVSASLEPARPRSLMIALDAIPYQTVAELTDPSLGDDAYFKTFQQPVPFISTFPSSTSVAMGGILGPLGLAKSPGYEAKFFDWEQRRARGGGLFSYFKVEFPWRTYFDWGRKGPVGSAFEAVHPVKSGVKRVRKALKDFLQSDQEVFLIYVAATDTAAHILDPEALKSFLIELDAMLLETRAQSSDRPFEVLMFSDHGIAGGDPLINTYKPIKRALRKEGFNVRKKLADSQDVVLTPFGLVSSFEVYLDDPILEPVSQALVSIDGVDLCAFRDEERIWVVDRDGRASIELRYSGEQLQWRYTSMGSDPLSYQPIMETILPRSASSGGWGGDREIFEASIDSDYPDALYRIQKSFEMVLNPASIACSLESGFMFGAPRTAALARFGKGRLRWTHGALSKEPSLGFLMSDSPDWKPPRAARFDEGLLPFVEAFSRREPR